MATQLDVKPGTFETITGESIGSFSLNVPTKFRLSGELYHLIADPVIKSGGVIVPSSAYTLFSDGAATTQEAAYTGATLYGAIEITNASYAGVALTVDGKNYGGYNSNEALIDYMDGLGSGKTAPGSDAYIKEGERAIFSDTTGLVIKSENSGEIALWDSGTSYSAAGTLARIEGITASATGASSNQNKYPLLSWNNNFWYVAPCERDLIRMAGSARFYHELHPVHDRAGSFYNQNLLVGKRSINSTQYNFHMIHLDGSTVTGNTTLETILGVGESWQNPFIDIIAPDYLGTRTLKDAGDYVFTPQSSGGDADAIGELVEDQLQGHIDFNGISNATTVVNVYGSDTSEYPGNATSRTSGYTGGTSGGNQGETSGPREDTANGYGTPRTGSTTHGKRLSTGAGFIISMVPA